MTSLLKFSQFYGNIRNHFSDNVESYCKFKELNFIEDQITFVLDSDIVKEDLSRLEECFSDFPKFKSKVQGSRTKETFLNPKNATFPQLTSKAKLATCKKSGRKIVASQKILPG